MVRNVLHAWNNWRRLLVYTFFSYRSSWAASDTGPWYSDKNWWSENRVWRYSCASTSMAGSSISWIKRCCEVAQWSSMWSKWTTGNPNDNIPLDKVLQGKWNFTNTNILEGFIQKTKDKDLIGRMKKYNEDFNYVRHSIPISDQKIVFEQFHCDKPCLVLILQNITYFDDIEIFLREVFDIYRRYLRVHKAVLK